MNQNQNNIPLSYFEDTIASKFPGLNQTQFVEELAHHVQVKNVKAGDILMEYGDYVRHIPLVVDGIVKVLRVTDEGEERLLYYLTDGEACAAAFSCCMIQKRSEFKTIAIKESQLWFVPLNMADKWMSTFAVWRNLVFTTFDRKMMELMDLVDSLSFSKLDDQLLNYLEHQSILCNKKSLKITHFEISKDLNVSREAVSRLLKNMEKQGKVKLERNKITLL